VKITRSELQVLNKKVKVLGKFDPTANPEEPDLQGVIGSIKEHVQNTFQLLHSAADAEIIGDAISIHDMIIMTGF
jgi:hypothetical protein